MDKKCEICGEVFEPRTNKSKFCSKECQYESYRKPKVDRIEVLCLFCQNKFEITEYDKNLGRGKYCSRHCKDMDQKEKYKGENNPMYGKEITEETKEKKSIKMKKVWEDNDYRERRKQSIENFVIKNGFHFGTDEKSKLKRKQTMLKKYGVEHNWIGRYGERKCDETTIKKYGKSSVDMLSEYTFYFGKQTDIEKIFKELLEDLGVEYQYKYRIYNKSKKPFWFREFDFLIENTNILVEIDGDYWHGNDKLFENLTDNQKETRKNDTIKEKFAIDKGYQVLRFWGSELKENYNNVKDKIFKILRENE